MTDISDALDRRRRGCVIFFRQDSPALSPLRIALERADRRTVVLWGLSEAERVAGILSERHPDDTRPTEAVRICRAWSEGDVRMPDAKRGILAVHAMARDTDPVDGALCHAVGQGCSCVHTPGHAMGLPVYELTAIVLENGVGCSDAIVSRVDSYVSGLERAEADSRMPRRWASFLRCFVSERCFPSWI